MPAIIELTNGNQYHTGVGDYDELIIGNQVDAQRFMASEGRFDVQLPSDHEAWNQLTEKDFDFYLPADHEAWQYLIKPDLVLNLVLLAYNSQIYVKMRSQNRKAGVFTVSPYYGRV